MPHPPFRPPLLFALLLPLLLAFAGYLLWDSLEPPAQPEVASTPSSALDSLLAYQVELAESPAADPAERTLGFRELLIYIALLAGLAAFLGHYLRSRLVWLAVLLLPLALSLWAVRKFSADFLLLYLVSLALAALVHLVVRHLFFHPALLRFRMPLCSVVGAGILTLYYRSVFLIFGQAFPAAEWTQALVNSLVLFVFVFFGLVIADLMIGRGRPASGGAIDTEDGASHNAD